MSSGLVINSNKFGDYALETAKLYVKKYNWCYMPSSVDKILIHRESITNHFAVLPVGNYRKMRKNHVIKIINDTACFIPESVHDLPLMKTFLIDSFIPPIHMWRASENHYSKITDF